MSLGGLTSLASLYCWWSSLTRSLVDTSYARYEREQNLCQGQDSSGGRPSFSHVSPPRGNRWASFATWAHLVEKIPELLLSLDNLLPVLDLLIFDVLLLQPGHKHAKTHGAVVPPCVSFSVQSLWTPVVRIALTVWPLPGLVPEKQACCWGSWSPAGGSGRRWPPVTCWTLAPPSHLFPWAPGYGHISHMNACTDQFHLQYIHLNDVLYFEDECPMANKEEVNQYIRLCTVRPLYQKTPTKGVKTKRKGETEKTS